MNEDQQAAVHQGVVLTDQLATKLESWINKHYRESIEPKDLADPNLIEESYAAIETLAPILDLPVKLLMDH